MFVNSIYAQNFTIFLFTLFISFAPLAENVNAIKDKDLSDLINLGVEDLLNIQVVITNDILTDERHVFSSFSKVNKDEWDTFSADRLLDTLKYTPGMDVHQSLGGAQTFSIRGYTDRTGSSRGKALLFDGIPLNGYAFGTSLYSKSFLQTQLFQSIEIAKGPISSFYGPDAFHGAMLMLPWQSEKLGAEFSVGLKDSESGFTRDLTTRASYNINKNTHLTSVISAQDQSNLSFDTTHTDDAFKNEYDSFSLYHKLNTDYGNFGLLFNKASSDDYYDIFDTEPNSEQLQGSSSVDEAKSQLIYYKDTYQWHNNIVIKPALWHNTSTFAFLFSDQSRYISWKDRQHGAKIHIEHDIGEHNLIYGVEFISSEVKESKQYNVGDPTSYSNFHKEDKEVSTFLFQYQYPFFNKKVIVNLGARFDHFSNTNAKEVSPKLGAIWLIDDNNTLKLLSSQGYRAPTAGEFKGTGTFIGNDDLEGETLNNLELVYLFKNNHMRFNLNLYKNEWRDAIVAIDNDIAGSSGTYTNSGDSKSAGAEIEFLYHIKRLNLWTFVNGAINKSENETLNFDYNSYPETTLSYGIQYKLFPWNISIKQLHKNSRTNLNTDNKELKDYKTTDFFTEYSYKDIKLNLAIDNVFNNNNVEPSIWGLTGGIDQYERRVKLGLNYLFEFN